jgi:hypothetical protein
MLTKYPIGAVPPETPREAIVGVAPDGGIVVWSAPATAPGVAYVAGVAGGLVELTIQPLEELELELELEEG